MKIIHCADIHADSKLDSHFTKEQAAQRREEIVDSFADMVRYAKENDVKVIIIAGDLFDTKTSQQKNIKKRISYIISQSPDIDFYTCAEIMMKMWILPWKKIFLT